MKPTAREIYKEFIDGLVALAVSSDGLSIGKGERLTTDAEEKTEKYNRLLEALGVETRAMIASLLHEAQSSGIHDTLAYLESEGYQIVKDGVLLPRHPFGTESFYDYVARREGDPWPD